MAERALLMVQRSERHSEEDADGLQSRTDTKHEICRDTKWLYKGRLAKMNRNTSLDARRHMFLYRGVSLCAVHRCVLGILLRSAAIADAIQADLDEVAMAE
jgi:hypothetical protein